MVCVHADTAYRGKGCGQNMKGKEEHHREQVMKEVPRNRGRR